MTAPPEPYSSPVEHADNGHGSLSKPAMGGETLPVLAREAQVLPARAAAASRSGGVAVPIVQAAAAAAGGFVAGAALAGLARRRQRRLAAVKPRRVTRARRRSASGGRSAGRPAELVQIVGSRSLLVDVHLLGER